MEKLILKYLQNELDRSETIALREWLQEREENRQVFENIVSHWKVPASELAAIKERVSAKVQASASKEEKIPPVSVFWRRAWRVAAILLIAAGLSYLLLELDWGRPADLPVTADLLIDKEAHFGQKLTLELSDGTQVKLNSGSRLTFPRHFAQGVREVQLVGEAFFNVSRDEQRPFVVRSGGVETRVLGTAFDVKAYDQERGVLVAVREGKVRVESSGTTPVTLEANEMAVFSGVKSVAKARIHDDAVIFGWLDQQLVLMDQPFDEVITTLARWYDVQFDILADPSSFRKAFTGTFKNPTLKEVMESLAYIYELQYEIDGKNVIITRPD